MDRDQWVEILPGWDLVWTPDHPLWNQAVASLPLPPGEKQPYYIRRSGQLLIEAVTSEEEVYEYLEGGEYDEALDDGTDNG